MKTEIIILLQLLASQEYYNQRNQDLLIAILSKLESNDIGQIEEFIKKARQEGETEKARITIELFKNFNSIFLSDTYSLSSFTPEELMAKLSKGI